MKADKFEIFSVLVLKQFDQSSMDDPLSIADLRKLIEVTNHIFNTWEKELDLNKKISRYVH